jgi:hypothetical protein
MAFYRNAQTNAAIHSRIDVNRDDAFGLSTVHAAATVEAHLMLGYRELFHQLGLAFAHP